MKVPPNVVINTLCGNTPRFNLIHFKDKTFKKTDPAHFYVTISLGDEKYLLITIITSQMENLYRYYIKNDDEDALNCLLPVSNIDFSVLTKKCVINCNNTQLLSKSELLNIIDKEYEGVCNKECISCFHFDYDFPIDLKVKILDGIEASPIVKDNTKEYVAILKQTFQPVCNN